jgi:hypothetical protein
MTNQLDTAILKAGLDLLDDDALLNLQNGTVPDGTTRPYALVYSWVSYPKGADANALDGRSRTIWARWQVHGVGDTPESAAGILQRARTQLLDRLLQLPDYPTVGIDPIEEDSVQPPTRDETTSEPVFDAIALYKARITT